VNKVNDALFEFYKQQKIVPEEEWDKFTETLKVILPSSFRIQMSLP